MHSDNVALQFDFAVKCLIGIIKLMKWFSKMLWKDKSEYKNMQSIQVLKREIEQIFERTKNWDFSINLVGELIGKDEFYITPKWQWFVVKGIESKEAYLNGKLCAITSKETKVTFTVRPNVSFAVLFLISLFWGLMLLVSLLFDGMYRERLVVGLILTFVVPAIVLLLAYSAKQRLKARFVQIFSLEPI